MSTTTQYRDRVRTVSFYAALGLVTYLLYVVTRPFLVPLCAAAILVVFFHPWHSFFERRYGRSLGAFVSTLLVTTMLIVPTVFVVTAFVREARGGIGNVQDAVLSGQFGRLEAAWTWLQIHTPVPEGLEFSEVVTDAAKTTAAFIAAQAGGLLKNVGVFLFHLVIVIFAMFFLFRDAAAIMAMIRRVLPFEDAHREQVILQTNALIRATVLSSFAVAVAQGSAGGVLFWLLGIGAPVFWGVMMAFCSLLPLAGAWVVWIPAGVWLIASGAVAKGVTLLVVGVAVISLIDNVLRPALLSGHSQMNGLLILISLLGGISAFGLIGLVIGPVVMATMASLLTAYTTPVIISEPREHREPLSA